jgi:hypothetical protein
MGAEKSGIGFNKALETVELEGITAKEFLRRLNNTEPMFDDNNPVPLSGAAYNRDQTPFTDIGDFTDAFETFRTEQGDTAFECQDSSRIDAAAKSQIIEAKIKVLMALNHIEKNPLAKAFAQHLKRELSYEDTKNLEAQELSDLWAAFKNWKTLRKDRNDAEGYRRLPYLEADLETVERSEILVANARAILEHLEDQHALLTSSARQRAQENRSSILQEMSHNADDAEIAFTNLLGDMRA